MSVIDKIDEIKKSIAELEKINKAKKSNTIISKIGMAVLTSFLTLLLFLAQRYYSNSDTAQNEATKEFAKMYIMQKIEHFDKCRSLVLAIDSAFETYCLTVPDKNTENKILDKISELNYLVEQHPHRYGRIRLLAYRYMNCVSDNLEYFQNFKPDNSLAKVYEESKPYRDSCILILESGSSAINME